MPELQIFLLIIEKDQEGQNKDGAGDINISHIEYRKIDQGEINKIPHVMKSDPVIQISCRPCSNKDQNKSQRKVFLSVRYPEIYKDQNCQSDSRYNT